MAEAKITYIRLRNRTDAVAGSLYPELGAQGNRALAKVALGEAFPVLVDSLPADLRAEYDAWEKAQTAPAPEPAPAPEVIEEAPAEPVAEAPAKRKAPAKKPTS